MLQKSSQRKQYFFTNRIGKKKQPDLQLRFRTNVNPNATISTSLHHQILSPKQVPRSQFYPSQTKNNFWIEYNKQRLQKKVVPAMKNFWHKIRSNSPIQTNMDIIIGFKTINFKQQLMKQKVTKEEFLKVKKKSMSERKTHFISNNNEEIKNQSKSHMRNTSLFEKKRGVLELPFIKQYSGIKGWDAQYHEQKNQCLQQPTWQ